MARVFETRYQEADGGGLYVEVSTPGVKVLVYADPTVPGGVVVEVDTDMATPLKVYVNDGLKEHYR
jgi:hypothetical protein